MELHKLLTIGLLLVCSGGMLTTTHAESCNESVCASIISKCMLIQNCKCEPKNCPCHEEFLNCLGMKYSKQCCSCVELCPPTKPNQTRNALSNKSHVEEFDGVPELFNALIISKPEEFEWDIVTFAIDLDDDIVAHLAFEEDSMKYWDDTFEERHHNTQVNCSVIYMSSCISWNKCRQSCHSYGASGYRWFHDGCCECVGRTCINYGINESRCKNCPESMDDEEEMDDELDNSDEEMDLFQFL